VWKSLEPFVFWLADTAFAQWLGQSTLRIAWLLTFHLFGLTLLLGTMFILNLRLLGVIQSRKPAAQVARDLAPGLWIGLALILVSGALIFTGGAAKYYESSWFRLKMILLLSAIFFHFTIQRTIIKRDEARISTLLAKMTAMVELLLWFSVGFSGRAIGFF
jgi:hypothetical protein